MYVHYTARKGWLGYMIINTHRHKYPKRYYISKKKKKLNRDETKIERDKLIIKRLPLIYLNGHNQHPDEQDQADDPKSKCSVPFAADCVLFEPGKGFEGYAGGLFVVDIGVASGGDGALLRLISVLVPMVIICRC